MGAHPDLCDRCERSYGEHTIFELGECRRSAVEGGPPRRLHGDEGEVIVLEHVHRPWER